MKTRIDNPHFAKTHINARMKTLGKILTPLIVSLLLLATGTAPAAARAWEPVKSERTDTRRVAKESDVEIRTAKGTIIVTTNRPAQIKVFTILGQLVSSETIPAGTSQLTVSAHGVYIVKIGELTVKVAL